MSDSTRTLTAISDRDPGLHVRKRMGAVAFAAALAWAGAGAANACSCARENVAEQIRGNPLTLVAEALHGAHGASWTQFRVLGTIRGAGWIEHALPQRGEVLSIAHRHQPSACGLRFEYGSTWLLVFSREQLSARPWRTNACRATRIGN